jgi:hypothetical protein
MKKGYFHQKLESLNKASPAATHNDHLRSVADSYASSKGIKIQHGMPKVKVDPEFASKVASAYHNMEHAPANPDTKASYDALIGETTEQLHHLQRNGYKFTPIKPEQPNPYASGSAALSADIRDNKHAHYYPTDQGFGSSGASPTDHPMLRTIKDLHGNEMPANDAFRVVHDIFGHAKEGHQFGPNGEEAAYRDHSQMFSPLARRALTAETRGQNSWVNFGPNAAHNKANPSKTIFADQKAGLLPTWAEEHYQNPEPIKKGENMDAPKPVVTPVEETPSQKYFKDKIKQIKDKFNAEQEAKSSASWKNNIKIAAQDAKAKMSKNEPPKEPPTLNYATMENSSYKPWHWKEKLAASKRLPAKPTEPIVAPAAPATPEKPRSFRDYANGIKKRSMSKEEMTNKLKGGEADGKDTKDFDPKALKEGAEHEKEHTKDRDTAKEIASDHLVSDKNYYKKLKKLT